GRELMTGFWGDYVAVFRAWSTHTIHVVRGPAATLGCMHRRCDDIDVYFSHMESVASLCDSDPEINWHALARSFLGPQWPGGTHLRGVREVAPGYCELIAEGRARAVRLWSPSQIAS